MPDNTSDRERLRQWVERWRRADPEPEEIRRREIEEVDTRDAIRQIFGSAESFFHHLSAPTTSGIAEQQALFAKLRRVHLAPLAELKDQPEITAAFSRLRNSGQYQDFRRLPLQ